MSGIEDYELPNAVVHRITKHRLPEQAIVSKDAKLALVKSATVFISYLTAIANDLARSESVRTLQAHHVIEAISESELEMFLPVLNSALAAEVERKKQFKKAKLAPEIDDREPDEEEQEEEPQVLSAEENPDGSEHI